MGFLLQWSYVTDLLTSTIKSHPHVILESVSRLREVFDYLMLLPLATADGLLRSIQPLLKLSPTLRDGLVIVLRKAIFSRYLFGCVKTMVIGTSVIQLWRWILLSGEMML